MTEIFLVVWIFVTMGGTHVSSVTLQIPQETMEICDQNRQNNVNSFHVENKEYWDGYEFYVRSSCIESTGE